ncbi:unnamed protein product [Spirodela intermedia]|uniref:Uncharacterized protein n=1 Tax=Spirodela intermedia TaxID=51605 RepID=A0A7I8I8C6_SPIIN|nr:unnamed protein product [Spirodela intermedia]CAA6653885.1 unnamed protein product [Spirodela intermedia]
MVQRAARPVSLPTVFARAASSRVPSPTAHSDPPAQPSATSALPSLPPSPATSTKLMSAYFSSGLPNHARQVFDKMSQRDVVSWTALISGYSSSSLQEDAFSAFCAMMAEGVPPNAYTISSVLKICSGGGASAAAALQGVAVKFGVDGQCYVANALLAAYAACGGAAGMRDARAIFDRIAPKTAVPWTTMIAGYVRSGDGHAAVEEFRRMLQPLQLLRRRESVCHGGILCLGEQIHSAAIKLGFEENLPVGNSLLDMYCRCRSLSEAEQFFREMRRRDLITWNTMISGMEKGSPRRAMGLLVEMGSDGLQPNCFTFTTIAAACGNLTLLAHGRQLHAAAVRRGYADDLPLANAIVDMYAKCGSIAAAIRVFDRMTRRDLVSWTSMMMGYGAHGLAEEAMKLFSEMIACGVSPDQVVLLGLLSACSHAGFVEEGMKYFTSLGGGGGVSSGGQETYGCVVDLLGRSGRIAEACEVMGKMPFEPDESVWGALLGACRIHGNAAVGKIAAGKILEKTGAAADAYAVLCTILQAGEWGEFARTRRMMRAVGARKEAGRSWVEAKGAVSMFAAADKQHPQMGLVYGALETLTEIMKTEDRPWTLEEIT